MGMTVTHTNEGKNFWKHFLKKKKERKKKEIQRFQQKFTNTGSGVVICSRCFLFIFFSITPLLGNHCVPTAAPNKRNGAGFRGFRTGGLRRRGKRGAWLMEFWLAYKGQPGVQRNNQGKGRPVLAFSEGQNESGSSALLSCQAGWWWKSEGQA